MSLAVSIYVPSGIVMATDSRISGLLTRTEEKKDGTVTRIHERIVFSDSAQKLLMFEKAGVAISTFDTAIVEKYPVEHHLKRFMELEQPEKETSIEEITRKLVGYFKVRFANTGVGFHVAGYRPEGTQHVPYVFSCHTLAEPTPTRRNAKEEDQVVYGITRSGETQITNRLIDASSTPVFDAMPLQDAVDYALFLMRTTIDTLRFEPRFPSVGGPIDLLVITPHGMRFLQCKTRYDQMEPDK
ncbi:MAG TPA: hypothetical protein VIL47_00405 [Candidatus Bipolaricaulota bacterium]